MLIGEVSAEKQTPQLKIESAKPKNWQPELKIGLFNTNAEIKLIADVPTTLVDSEYGKPVMKISKGQEIKIAIANDKIQFNGKELNLEKIEIRPQDDTKLKSMQISINNKKYFGSAKIIMNKKQLSIINIVTVENYLRCVLPKEMSPSFHEEALKAQAVAARTFSLVNRKRHKSEGYDLCNTTHCQIYGGIDNADAMTDKIINKTFGEVIYYNGKLIQSVFHTDSGGMTENALDVWGIDYPYLRASTELESKTQSWTERITLEDFSKKLIAANKSVGNVQFIKCTNLEIGKITNDRSPSGRLKEVSIIGDKGEIKISGTELRSILKLKSTLFDISVSGNEVVINGYGHGHGVGMSQLGAQTFAEHGYSYDKILLHYYKNTTLKRLY